MASFASVGNARERGGGKRRLPCWRLLLLPCQHCKHPLYVLASTLDSLNGRPEAGRRQNSTRRRDALGSAERIGSRMSSPVWAGTRTPIPNACGSSSRSFRDTSRVLQGPLNSPCAAFVEAALRPRNPACRRERRPLPGRSFSHHRAPRRRDCRRVQCGPKPQRQTCTRGAIRTAKIENTAAPSAAHWPVRTSIHARRP